MRVWRLIPVDLQASSWRATTYKGAVVIRALSEREARELARDDFQATDRHRSAPKRVQAQPWTSPEVVRAELIDDPLYPPAGGAGILALS